MLSSGTASFLGQALPIDKNYHHANWNSPPEPFLSIDKICQDPGPILSIHKTTWAHLLAIDKHSQTPLVNLQNKPKQNPPTQWFCTYPYLKVLQVVAHVEIYHVALISRNGPYRSLTYLLTKSRHPCIPGRVLEQMPTRIPARSC